MWLWDFLNSRHRAGAAAEPCGCRYSLRDVQKSPSERGIAPDMDIQGMCNPVHPYPRHTPGLGDLCTQAGAGEGQKLGVARLEERDEAPGRICVLQYQLP